MPLKKIPYKEELKIRDDGSRVLYQSKIHVGLLQLYTSDAADFTTETAKIESLNHENLIAYAEKYHNQVCEDEKCIIYEKKVPGIRISVEAIYGLSLYNGEVYNVKRTDDFGFHAYFWMPKANERLFFKTGYIHLLKIMMASQTLLRFQPRSFMNIR
ncbi:MAG: hypothetical protein ACOC10_03715 [Bacteroidota bacterium]